MITESKRPTLEAVQWTDVKEAVKKVHLEFAKTIDEFQSQNNFRLYKAKYPFGSTIIDKGIAFYPIDNGLLVPMHDARLDPIVRDDLSYTGSLSAGIVLNHSMELFMETKERITPFSLMKPGKIFALWRALDRDPFFSYHSGKAWNMVAGARNIFMLPKITDSVSYNRLRKKRGIKLPLARGLIDQQPIFKQMCQHKDFSPWYTEVLFFSKDWFKKRDDHAWIKFHHFLLEEAWENTQFWRNKIIFDFIWDSFVKELERRNFYTKPYIIDIVKHLIVIALGVLPGFSPAIDEEIAPIKELQNDFLETYGLKNFFPTIMVPHYFNLYDKNSQPVYWSLQLPNYFESTPKPRTVNSVIEELRNVKTLLTLFTNSILEGEIEDIPQTLIEDCIKMVSFDYFHSEVDSEGEIRLANEMFEEDNIFITHKKKFKKGFSHISPFVRGCVRIAHK